MAPEAPAPLAPRPELWLPQEGSVRIAVRGDSMRPTFREGDRLEVRRCAPGDLRVGDVAAFTRAGELTVHRAVALRDGAFLEMGDAQERGNWQPWPEALGFAVAHEPTGGSRRELNTPEARERSRALARRMRRRHRAASFAEALPGELCRRLVRRLLRPWLKPPRENAEF